MHHARVGEKHMELETTRSKEKNKATFKGSTFNSLKGYVSKKRSLFSRAVVSGWLDMEDGHCDIKLLTT